MLKTCCNKFLIEPLKWLQNFKFKHSFSKEAAREFLAQLRPIFE